MENELKFRIKYAPNTVLVHKNSVIFINILGLDVNQYIEDSHVPVQKLSCLSEASKELIISKLN